MTDTIISWEETVDPQACNTNETIYHSRSRDPARTPMQWDDSKNGGFNRGKKTWLPVNTNYKCTNVKKEQSTFPSYLNNYKRLAKLRKEAKLQTASYEPATFGKSILTYRRYLFRNLLQPGSVESLQQKHFFFNFAHISFQIVKVTMRNQF